MKWIVGCDLLPDAEGALAWITWMQHRGAVTPAETAAIRVVEELAMFPLPAGDRMRIRDAALEALRESLQQHSSVASFGESDVVLDPSVHEALAEQARSRAATLVVGRRARRGEDRLVRLGGTARKLLRDLPGPVVVVPRDARERDFGEGPIVVALDLEGDALAAVRFGDAVARRLGRKMVIAHVLPYPTDPMWAYVSADRARALRAEHDEHMRSAFAKFLKEFRLDGYESVPLSGPPADALIELAARVQSPLLVCGSRKLGIADRVLSVSMGTELAAAATVPVAVVPADLPKEWLT